MNRHLEEEQQEQLQGSLGQAERVWCIRTDCKKDQAYGGD
jgi:hypothetical protein